MSISMYQSSVPIFRHMLGNLKAIMEKAKAHCEANKIDPSVLVNYRLYPDMFSFARQVQIAADAAKNGTGYLAGETPPAFENVEQGFDDLIGRIDKTQAYIDGFPSERIDDSEEREVVIQRGETTLRYKGQEYLLYRVLPNFYFHVTTAYDILRHNGVLLGKRDFLGSH